MSINKTKIALIFLITSIFVIPLLTFVLGVTESSLKGVEKGVKQVPFTSTTFSDGTFQSYFEKNFQRGIGLLTYLIKGDNQLNYSIFGMASSNPRSRIILGRNNHLIERPYLRSANRFNRAGPVKLKEMVRKLNELQVLLEQNGTTLVFLISPNKPYFYPEIVPKRYRVSGWQERFDPRLFVIKELDLSDVNYIDGVSFLKHKEAEIGFPMFATSGTHWNELGGCLIAAEVVRLGAQISNKNYREINCKIDGLRESPVYQDTDLLQIANFWFPEKVLTSAPRVFSLAENIEHGIRPRITLVGSSFVWEILRHLERARATSDNEFLYYFKRRVLSSQDEGHPLDIDKFDVQRTVFDKDIVVIEINQSFLNRAGYGFIERVLN